MKQIVYLTVILLGFVVLSACTGQASRSGDEMINPDDKIGNFTVTAATDDTVVYTTLIHCPFDSSTNTETCEFAAGKKVNVGLGVYGKSKEELDTYWAGQTYKMTIEGRPVNLEAFGPVEITHPVVGIIRLWNVVIVSDTPGKITVQHSGEMAGQSMDGANVLIYINPE